MTPSILWLIAGAGFLTLEAFGATGIGFLFAGLSALLVGAAIELGLIADNAIVLQFALFLIATSISAALLWKKLKSWRVNPASGGEYSNIVGDTAVVAETIARGAEGKVKWSGTLMRAALDASCSEEHLAEQARVEIVAVEGTLLRVKPQRV